MNKTYRINTQKALSETLDNETIIINMDTGNYYSMNHPGSAVWHGILAGKSFDTNIDSVATFLTSLEHEGLIQEASSDEAGEVAVIEGDPKLDKYEDMQEMLLADPIHDVEELGWPKLKENQ